MNFERCDRLADIAQATYPRIAEAIVSVLPIHELFARRGGSLGIMDYADARGPHAKSAQKLFCQLSYDLRRVVPHGVTDLANVELSHLIEHPELMTSRAPTTRPNRFAAAVRGAEHVVAFAGDAWREDAAEFVVLAVLVAASELDPVQAIRLARMGTNAFGRQLEHFAP